MKNILICDRFSMESLIDLKKNKNFHVENYSADKLETAHALIIRSKFPVTKEIIAAAKNLQVIVTCTSGFDHIDLNETSQKKITVMYTPDANVVSAAEHTWALLLACSRNIVAAHKEIKAGQWARDPFVGFELENKVLGIVGLGRIGQKVSQIAKAFQMKVIAFDPYQTEEAFKKHDATRVSYEELLKQSDIISFHVPATFETKNMLNRSHFEYTNPETILINTSRGSVIHEDDLCEALQEKKIKMAALDVFSKEPLPRDSKLLKAANVILTPHLGAFTSEAFEKASAQAVTQLNHFFENQISTNTLPLKNDWGTLSFKERN